MKKKNNKPPKTAAGRDRMLSLFPLDEEEEKTEAETPELVGPEADGRDSKRADAPPLEPVARPLSAAPDLTDGRDELNLTEFPLTLLSDRPPDGVVSLTFSDTVYDSGDGGRPVNRTLTVTPAAGLGLPTPPDGDVLLALVQLTRWKNGFTARQTEFTRYEIIKLLRWPDKGDSYARVEQSLNRWMGVTLFFDRAWWDKRQRAWVNEKFHVLDRVSLRTGREGVSSFTWGEVPFNSFRAENIKKLDLQTYFDLHLPSARRLYRFLDKRFHQSAAVSFDLRTLACEHVGFSREYPNAELKRRFLPAVCELEGIGYIDTATADERFVSPHHGTWRAFFQKREKPAPADGLAADLVARGVSPPVAAALVAGFPGDHVQARLGVFDWLVAEKDRRVERNPPGYLVQSIRVGYAPPPDYRPERPKGPVPPVVSTAALDAPAGPTPVEAYLAALDAPARTRLEADALVADPQNAAAYKTSASEVFRAAALARAVAAHVGRLIADPS